MTMQRNLKPAVVKIDGEKVRRIREEQGLTQLYLATAVNVTTDTISRWENRRYPTIKYDNAVKLAQALEVDLETILETDEAHVVTQSDDKEVDEERTKSGETKESFPLQGIYSSKWKKTTIPAIILLLITPFFLYFFMKNSTVEVSAQRWLPHHTPPMTPFPVIIRIENLSDKPQPIILSEKLPKGVSLVKAIPSSKKTDTNSGTLKWIREIKGGESTIFYLARIEAQHEQGQLFVFEGKITAQHSKEKLKPVEGSSNIKLLSFHWADLNMDNKIDDQEILTAYDALSGISELGKERALIEEIWSSSGYHWDPLRHQFVIE